MSSKLFKLINSRQSVVATVWMLRVVVGVVFVISGVAKLIDLWGTVFKIEDYAAVWDIDVPRTVIMVSALALATFEFTSGSLLILGCYRKAITWLLALCMAFMLPLTAYIWYADPVSDCGCFGDMIVLSNSSTFFKNIILSIFIIYLIINNYKVKSLYNPSIQWVVVVVLMIYAIIISLIGYNVQPLVDFRPYKVGDVLVDESEDDSVQFIYTNKQGEKQVFDAINLPGDEWEFLDRIEPVGTQKTLTLYDSDTGDDVTYDYLETADSLLMLVIPEPSRADLSNTYAINELYEEASNLPSTQVIALLATDSKGIERWKDHSMASYPCLQVDDTQLKQLSRGVMSMVWVTQDTIRWKRTVASIKNEDVKMIVAGKKSFETLKIDGPRYFYKLTLILVSFLLVLYILQAAIIEFFNTFIMKHNQ